MAIRARQIFRFSDKVAGFSEIIELCLNLGTRFYITLLVLTNLEKTKQSVKNNLPREPP